jgi:hypothetical protein
LDLRAPVCEDRSRRGALASSRRPTLWSELARISTVVFGGFAALLALGTLAEIAAGHWFGVSAADAVGQVKLVTLTLWALNSPVTAQLIRDSLTIRSKAILFLLSFGGEILFLLAVMPDLLHQPLRPWLSAIILLGGIWSLILVGSILVIRKDRKTSATPTSS